MTLGFISFVFLPLRLPLPPANPMVLGASWATGLGRYGGLAAVPAEAQFLGLLPSFLLLATVMGRPVRVLASELFVPLAVLMGGILLNLVRDGASRRIPC